MKGVDLNHDRSPFIVGKEDALSNRAFKRARYESPVEQNLYQLGFDAELKDMIEVTEAMLTGH